MEITKKIIVPVTILSFAFVIFMDYINITQYVNYNSHIDSVIANIITFISILIGFISAIYVMVLQSQNSYVLELIRKQNLIDSFNKSFKTLMYVGFITVIILITMNIFADNIIILKPITYIACPLTTYFIFSSNTIIITICKMISAEEQLKKLDRKIEKKDIKL